MTDSDRPHEYKPREVIPTPEQELRVGEGRISGNLAILLGVLSFLGVLCYRFPSYLTTADLRAAYDADVLQTVLMVGMWFSLFFCVLTFVFQRYRARGAIGALFTLAAFGLGGYSLATGSVEPAPLSLGLDWLILSLVSSALVFVFLEKIFPQYRDQVILWAVNAELQQFLQSLPLLAQVVLLVICADFVLYWSHRLFHEVPSLWKFHAVHHSVETMDWLAGSRNHFFQAVVDRSLAMVPLYLLGVDKAALDIYVAFAALQAVFVHANIGIPFGPLKYIIATPQYHHWHHSTDRPAIDTNYAVHTPLFDRLFGSYHMPVDHWPQEYGTTQRLPRGFISQFLYPFRSSKGE